MSRLPFRSTVVSLAALVALTCSACSEPQCPPGFEKIGKVCRRLDAGTEADEAGALGEDEEDAGPSDGLVGSGDEVTDADATQRDATIANAAADAGVEAGGEIAGEGGIDGAVTCGAVMCSTAEPARTSTSASRARTPVT